MLDRKNIIVISGPSGSGKSTLIQKLFEKHPTLNFSISHTTRSIRKGEKEGVDYHYVTHEQFELMKKSYSFVEWAKVYLNYYGTSWEEIEKKSSDGQILILDLDIQGARKIKEKFDEAVLILISPPSYSELKKRLVGREQNENEDIRTRLEIALSELEEFRLYDYIIINDELKIAFEKLDSIFTAFQHRTQFKYQKIMSITENWKNS